MNSAGTTFSSLSSTARTVLPGATPLAVELGLEKVVPPDYALHAHHWLILHGRYVCKARKPNCPECAIRDLCAYRHKTPGPPPVVPAKAGTERLGDAKPMKRR